MKKYLVFVPAIILAIGGAGLLLWAQVTADRVDYLDAKEYAPNFWFDSDEKYYPTNPLDFYYDENSNELPGKIAVAEYDKLSLDEKLKKVKVFYNISDAGDEIVYQYWLFYVMNNYENGHYGDWESVFVFVDKESKNINKAVGSAHGSGHKLEIKSEDARHIWVYVGNGSHANCPDEVGEGRCDFTLWNWGEQGQSWTTEDIESGKKLIFSEYVLGKIEPDYISNFSNQKSFDTEKSPALGVNIYRTLRLEKFYIPQPKEDKYYNLPVLGKTVGQTPTFAWAKEEYQNPQKILVPTHIKIATNISGFFKNTGSFLAAIGKKATSPVGNLFTAQVGNREAKLTVDAGPPASLAGDFTPQLRGEIPAPTPNPTVAPAPSAEISPSTPLRANQQSADISSEVSAEQEIAFVSYVIDGDTVELSNGHRLRYIGIDAPELPDSCFAKEATEKNRALAEGKQVILLSGPSNVDKYNRFLRFVWLDENNNSVIDSPDPFINLALVEEGYASAADFGAAHTYSHRLEAAEAKAKRERLGLWGDACDPKKEAVAPQPTPRVLIYEPPTTPAPSTDPVDLTAPTSTIAVVHPIRINEIQVNDSEFVELYNPGSSTTSLAGYYFSYYPSTRTVWTDPFRNKKFLDSASIGNGGYYLIGLKGHATTTGNPTADWQPYSSAQLSNEKGTVAIFPFDPTSATTSQYAYDNRVDAIGWGLDISLYEGTSATTTPAAGASLTRNTNHTDTNNNSSDFTVAASTTPTNSKGETYVPPPPLNPVWAMYQKDARHSGLTTLAGPNWTSSVQATSTWTFSMDSTASSPPVIDGLGIVYAMDGEGKVYAINTNGTQKWKFEPKVQGGNGVGWASASPALSSDGSRIYSTYTDTSINKLVVYSIHTSDGSLDWKYSPTENGYNQTFTSPVLDESGNIYVASNTKLYSIAPNGNLRWEFTPTSQFSSSALWIRTPAIAKEGSNEYAYITAQMSLNGGDKYIFKVDASNGTKVWHSVDAGVNSALLSGVSINATGTIYTGGYLNIGTSGLFAVHPTDGSKIWNNNIGDSLASNIPSYDAGGNIFLGTVDTGDIGAFHKVNATNTILWSFVPDASPSAVQFPSVIDGQGRVYIGAKNTFIYALTPENGSIIWKYQLSNEPRGFAIGNDALYAVSYDGKIYALK